MSDNTNTIEPSPKGNKKTIQINQSFFKIGKKNTAPIAKTRKNKPKDRPIANNTIKQALAKRVQERKQKDLDETSYERKEKERRLELEKRHQDKMDAWKAERDSREKLGLDMSMQDV